MGRRNKGLGRVAWIMMALLIGVIATSIAISVGSQAQEGAEGSGEAFFNSTAELDIRRICEQKDSSNEDFDCTVEYNGDQVDCESVGYSCD